MAQEELTTAEAADKVGIGRVTLQRWIASGRIRAPRTILLNGHAVRLWAAKDIERLQKVKDKTFCKGRGHKKKS